MKLYQCASKIKQTLPVPDFKVGITGTATLLHAKCVWESVSVSLKTKSTVQYSWLQWI